MNKRTYFKLLAMLISNCVVSAMFAWAGRRKTYKLGWKREALEKLNRRANEMAVGEAQSPPMGGGFGTVLVQ